MTDAELAEIESRSIGAWGDFEPLARADVRELAREVRRVWAKCEEMKRTVAELIDILREVDSMNTAASYEGESLYLEFGHLSGRIDKALADDVQTKNNKELPMA